jgi:hypothetical protein
MRVIRLNRRGLLFAFAIILGCARFGIAAEPELTKEQIKEFLLKAKVIKSTQTKKGITNPFRLTLTDGTITHEAVFQAVDQRKTSMQLADGRTEINFVDSYKYNIAGYILAEILGIDDMIPIHVERKWNGKIGSLSWLVPVQMDEGERLQRKISAPNTEVWNKQMYKMRVFGELVYDTDPNLTNFLIGENFKLWRVDFSRAFRLYKDLKNPKNLVQVDRQLLGNLRALNEAEVREKTKNLLTTPEVQGVMARRDKIVEYFQRLIAEKGEGAVLF